MSAKQDADQNKLVLSEGRELTQAPELVTRGLTLAESVSKPRPIQRVYETRRLNGHKDSVNSVAFLQDGRYAVSGSTDKTVRLWDLIDGREIRQFRGEMDSVNCVAFTSISKYVVAGCEDGTIHLWDLSGRDLRVLHGHTASVTHLALMPNGQRFFSASLDGTIRMWDISNNEGINRIEGYISITLSPNGQLALAETEWWPSVKLLDVANAKEVHSFDGEFLGMGVAFSPDGYMALIGSGAWNTTVRLWDCKSGQEISKFVDVGYAFDEDYLPPDYRDYREQVLSGAFLYGLDTENPPDEEDLDFGWNCLAFSPDGRRILCSNAAPTFSLWDLQSARILFNFIGHTGGVPSVVFSPDGRSVLSGSVDGTVRLWNLPW